MSVFPARRRHRQLEPVEPLRHFFLTDAFRPRIGRDVSVLRVEGEHALSRFAPGRPEKAPFKVLSSGLPYRNPPPRATWDSNPEGAALFLIPAGQ